MHSFFQLIKKSAVGPLMKTLFPASKRESPKMNNAACFFSTDLARQVDGMRRPVAPKRASTQNSVSRLAMILNYWLMV